MATNQRGEVTAVDVLLVPDAVLMEHASAVNDRLRSAYPDGFALDAGHRPHVTLIQSYFPTAQLDDIYAEVQRVFDGAPVAAWILTAVRYYYLPWRNLGLAGIVVTPTAELKTLQQLLLDAVAPFATVGGTADAFVTSPDDSDINQATLDYVGAFTHVATGPHFNPHVSVGMGLQRDLDEMLAEPFEEFTFRAAGAASYQLGNFGTASKLLHSWELHP